MFLFSSEEKKMLFIFNSAFKPLNYKLTKKNYINLFILFYRKPEIGQLILNMLIK